MATYVGTTANDRLVGGIENDILAGEAGSDTLNGGDGFDLAAYDFDPGAVDADLVRGTAFDGHGGTDTLISIEALNGSAYGDILAGDDNNNDFRGLGGNDFIQGRGGNDWMRGDAGNDTLNGGSGHDAVSYSSATSGIYGSLLTGRVQDGLGGVDTLIDIEEIRGSDYADTVLGGSNADGFDGYDGNDLFDGNEGNDDVWGGKGNDTLDGGEGFDRLSFYTADEAVNVKLPKGTAGDGFGSVDTFQNFEALTGTRYYDDRLQGDGRANYIEGWGGNDTILGLGGKDWLWGGDGDDLLNGGRGNDAFYASFGSDTLIGGKGTDELRIYYSEPGTEEAIGQVVIDLQAGEGYATGAPENGVTVLRSIENVTATFLNDIPTSTGLAREAQFDLKIIGTKGKNALTGGGGDDEILGGKGNDTLNGAAGDDLLTGGKGMDRFVFHDDWGSDTVTDFHNDLIEISGRGEAGTFKAFLKHAEEIDGDVVYDKGGDGENVIVLEDLSLSDLNRGDFLFV